MRSISLLVLTLTLVAARPAQIASGGNYALEKSVISGGGSTLSGDAYLVTGTAAQSMAGFVSTGGSYGVRSGFWQPSLAPTAASVSIGGRVTATLAGAGTQVFLTDMSGVTRSTFASSFGYYRFDDVEIGQIYIISATHKQYNFEDSPRVLMVLDELSDVDFFIASPIQ